MDVHQKNNEVHSGVFIHFVLAFSCLPCTLLGLSWPACRFFLTHSLFSVFYSSILFIFSLFAATSPRPIRSLCPLFIHECDLENQYHHEPIFAGRTSHLTFANFPLGLRQNYSNIAMPALCVWALTLTHTHASACTPIFTQFTGMGHNIHE